MTEHVLAAILNGGVRSGEEEEKVSIGKYVEGALYVSSSSRLGFGVNPHVPAPQSLYHSWTFWFDTPSLKIKQSAWGSSMRKAHTIGTVEEFWSLHNCLHPPSKLVIGSDLYCFKHNIEPKWEDPICENGGKWTVLSQRLKADAWWLDTLLVVIGEQFVHGEEICGVVVNVRSKQEKISIWTKNAANEAAQLSIGKQWKEFLGCREQIGYIVHEDAKKYDRQAKHRYVI